MNALFLALALTQPGDCQVTVYSYNDACNRFLHSHSWAVFERGAEKVVISWGPAKGSGVGALKTPVPGRNYTHEQTVGFAASLGLRVAVYGPYRIRPELFANARAWARTLDSGWVSYVLIDRYARQYALNCVSAVQFVTGFRTPTGLKHGYTASAAVVRHLQPYFVP